MQNLKLTMPRIIESLAADFEKLERHEYGLQGRTEVELAERMEALERIIGKVVEPLVEIAFERGRRSVAVDVLKLLK